MIQESDDAGSAVSVAAGKDQKDGSSGDPGDADDRVEMGQNDDDEGQKIVDGANERNENMPEVQIEFEHHCFCRQFGDAALLVLDIVSSRLTEDYHVDPHAPLLGDAQVKDTP